MVWAGLAWELRDLDSSRPDQEFVFYVGPDLRFVGFSLVFVDLFFLLVWAGLAWGLRGFDSSRPDQVFRVFIWPRSEICCFSSFFVEFLCFCWFELAWPVSCGVQTPAGQTKN